MSTARTIMILANMLIAIDYLAIAIYWMQQIRMPIRHRNGDTTCGSLIVVIAASVFFAACAHTHIDIVLAMRSGETIWDHWLDWFNIISHLAQGMAGAVFAAGATYWIHVRVFDRKQYDATISRAKDHRRQPPSAPPAPGG